MAMNYESDGYMAFEINNLRSRVLKKPLVFTVGKEYPVCRIINNYLPVSFSYTTSGIDDPEIRALEYLDNWAKDLMDHIDDSDSMSAADLKLLDLLGVHPEISFAQKPWPEGEGNGHIVELTQADRK